MAFPDVVTVTCDGDYQGGTHVSSPVVRPRADGVHLRVINLITNERVFLTIEPDGGTHAVSGGGTVTLVVSQLAAGDVELVCTYVHPPGSWERSSHLLWIATS
jgi:hypothetical protein